MPFATPREVGYPPSKLEARKNLRLVMTDRQKEILIGSILGDGYIYRQGKIQIEHAVGQKEYLFWKFDELSSLAYPSLPALFIDQTSEHEKRTQPIVSGFVSISESGDVNFMEKTHKKSFQKD